jgi:hypothetical protein
MLYFSLTFPPFNRQYDDSPNYGGSCVCCHEGWSYGLLECFVTVVRPINVDVCDTTMMMFTMSSMTW